MNRRKFFQLGAAALASSVTSCTAVGGYAHGIEPQQLMLERRTIRIRRFNAALEGFRLVLMSDHHLFPYTPRELIERAVEQANALNPDLVLLGGDYIYRKVEAIHELAPVLGRLNAKYGVFAVLGNHDCWEGPDVVRSELSAHSIEVLVNRGVHLGPQGGRLYLAGLDSVWGGRPDPKRAFAGCRQNDVALALVHEPDYFPTMVRSTPVQLQLSGHSHGGQVRLPALGPMILPAWGQIFHTGLYDLEGRLVYTGRGLGMVGMPVRFDCPPELTEVTLTAA